MKVSALSNPYFRNVQQVKYKDKCNFTNNTPINGSAPADIVSFTSDVKGYKSISCKEASDLFRKYFKGVNPEIIRINIDGEVRETLVIDSYNPSAKQIKKFYKNEASKGISEQSLFENISKVRGNLFLNNSELKYLENIEQICGNLDIRGSEVDCLGSLKEILGNAYINSSPLKTKGELEYVGGVLRYDPLQSDAFWAVEKGDVEFVVCSTKPRFFGLFD